MSDNGRIVIRVIGDDRLKILRTGEEEPVQLFPCFQFEDIIFEKFPKVGREAYGFWAKDSVGDINEMLKQMLEALTFIHGLNIAHRILGGVPRQFRHPIASRVVAHDEIDFEVDIQFPVECPDSERVSMALPLGGSFTKPEYYARRHAP